ncbi:diaminopimelate epimerase [Lactobacillaceae bacterium 24-114]
MTELLKVHGSQNSFFILDQTKLKQKLTDIELVSLARQITNQKTGLLGGADGLLVVNQPVRKQATAQMRVINADGSEASMCGNGLRTVARYVAERDGKDNFKVDTMNASLQVRKQDDLAPNVPAFAVEISPVSFQRESLPYENLGHDRLLNTLVPELLPGFRFSGIAVPNPHLISFVNEDGFTKLGKLGEWLNGDNPYFPDGVNINFAHILGPNQIFVKTFERGVGFTNACGTGMSATSLAFALIYPKQAKFNQEITVFNPGGMVKTILHHEGNRYWIELVGNATFTHKVTVNEPDLHDASVSTDNTKVEETGEQDSYLSFINNLDKPNL